MGYPLSIATNSERVHSTAARIWSRYPRLSDELAVRLNIAVTAGGGALAPPAPLFRGRDHLFSVVADRDNFATADLRTGTGFACFTDNVSNDYLRYHFLEPLAYVLIAARYLTFTHSACVALHGRGVLLCGDSGAGKTCLAFACARKGWTFLSGDATAIVRGRDDYRLLGRPFEIRFRETARRLFPELEQIPTGDTTERQRRYRDRSTGFAVEVRSGRYSEPNRFSGTLQLSDSRCSRNVPEQPSAAPPRTGNLLRR